LPTRSPPQQSELATAVDVADTPTDVTPTRNFGAASETTPDESPDEVTGFVAHFEHLSLPGAAANSNGGTGDREGEGGVMGRVLALKTEGNQHFSAGEYSPALPLYQSASALTDAERAGALCGGMKAHFRRAEALSSMRRYEEALEASEAALANAVSDCAALTLRFLDCLLLPAIERAGQNTSVH